jgi:hypothetical protein
LPSVLFGILIIPLLFFFVKRLSNKRVALITAFLVTFFVLEIAWSRQARMYQQLQFFYLLSLFLFYEFTQRKTIRYLILTIISTICTMLSHAFGFSLIIIFFVYLLIVNIGSLKKYFNMRVMFDLKTIIPILCGIALLVIGEVVFGIFSNIWSTRMNYFSDYTFYLKEILPIILYLAPVGAIIFFKKDNKASLLLILAAVIPFYFICFHVKLLGFRYLYFFIPIIFIFFAFAINCLSTLIPWNKLRPVLSWVSVIILLGLMMFSQGFNFTPQPIYYLEPAAPQPDLKQAYQFINNNTKDGDIVIDTWPAVGKYYLVNPPDYWLAFDIGGTGRNYAAKDDSKREYHTNTLMINDLESLENVMADNPRGWLVIDGLSRYRLPPSTVKFIEQNLTHYPQGSSRNIAGEVWVYGWGR